MHLDRYSLVLGGLLVGLLLLPGVALSQQAAPARTAEKSAGPAEFRIGPGDVLMINVWREQEISGEVTVRPDGHISLPLLKDVSVSGMTAMEIERLVSDGLKKFVSEPDVTVVVRQINSKKVYVVGQVRRVGSILLLAPMNIVQVLSEAGGPTEYANTKKIVVLREENGKQVRLKFNYKDFLDGDGGQENIVLQPGDTVVVP